jgi:hypothetical protein
MLCCCGSADGGVESGIGKDCWLYIKEFIMIGTDGSDSIMESDGEVIHLSWWKRCK